MPSILIVDDSPTEQQAYQEMLEKHGYAVEQASDGDSGLKLAAQLKPALIIMDVVMPGMNGFQATRQLEKNPDTAGIPVIIVTWKDQETDKVWGLRQGARDYLTKPVRESDLLERVNGLLGND